MFVLSGTEEYPPQSRPESFAEKFFSVYDKWSCTKEQRYVGLLQWDNKKALGQFKSLFGGKNKNAMNTIRMVLVDYNMDNDNLSEWGIVKVDSRRTFLLKRLNVSGLNKVVSVTTLERI